MFYKQSLEGFEPFMAASADLLVQRVGAAAKDGAAVNIDALVQKLSLAVISHACFGISCALATCAAGCDESRSAALSHEAGLQCVVHDEGLHACTPRQALPSTPWCRSCLWL